MYVNASDRCLTDVNLKVFFIWEEILYFFFKTFQGNPFEVLGKTPVSPISSISKSSMFPQLDLQLALAKVRWLRRENMPRLCCLLSRDFADIRWRLKLLKFSSSCSTRDLIEMGRSLGNAGSSPNLTLIDTGSRFVRKLRSLRVRKRDFTLRKNRCSRTEIRRINISRLANLIILVLKLIWPEHLNGTGYTN